MSQPFSPHQLPTTIAPNLTNASSATLFIISPVNYGVQVRRPYLYNFDDAFLQQAATQVTSSMLGGRRTALDALEAYPSFGSSMIPVADNNNATFLNYNHLASCPTFILIVDNERQQIGSTIISSVSPLANQRAIYSGYFTDTPLNLGFGRQTVNDQCSLVITHTTYVNRQESWMGQTTRTRYDTVLDLDTVHGQTMRVLGNKELHLMTPKNLVDLSEPLGGGQVADMIGPSSSLTSGINQNPIPIDSKLMIPQNNVRHILGSVSETLDEMRANDQMGTMSNSPTADLRFSGDEFSERLGQHLQGNAAFSFLPGLKAHELITMGEIVRRYNPTIQPIDIPNASMYATIDQSDTSAISVFSNLIAAVVPPIISNASLLSITFIYDSYYDQFQLRGYEGAAAMDDHTAQQKIQAAIFTLKKTLFAALKGSRGDFILDGMFHTVNVSSFILNFRCDNQVNRDFFEVPTIYGGLNTPLAGDATTTAHNVMQINGLIQACTDYSAPRDLPPNPFGTFR